ncbi:MAG: hypothetical protein M1814_004497 [Vezdaea aestivalis]|nr:MAG: hypothetical protein M1814_004497 [Vezdaea aestivalis]
MKPPKMPFPQVDERCKTCENYSKSMATYREKEKKQTGGEKKDEEGKDRQAGLGAKKTVRWRGNLDIRGGASEKSAKSKTTETQDPKESTDNEYTTTPSHYSENTERRYTVPNMQLGPVGSSSSNGSISGSPIQQRSTNRNSSKSPVTPKSATDTWSGGSTPIPRSMHSACSDCLSKDSIYCENRQFGASQSPLPIGNVETALHDAINSSLPTHQSAKENLDMLGAEGEICPSSGEQRDGRFENGETRTGRPFLSLRTHAPPGRRGAIAGLETSVARAVERNRSIQPEIRKRMEESGPWPFRVDLEEDGQHRITSVPYSRNAANRERVEGSAMVSISGDRSGSAIEDLESPHNGSSSPSTSGSMQAINGSSDGESRVAEENAADEFDEKTGKKSKRTRNK